MSKYKRVSGVNMNVVYSDRFSASYEIGDHVVVVDHFGDKLNIDGDEVSVAHETARELWRTDFAVPHKCDNETASILARVGLIRILTDEEVCNH